MNELRYAVVEQNNRQYLDRFDLFEHVFLHVGFFCGFLLSDFFFPLTDVIF